MTMEPTLIDVNVFIAISFIYAVLMGTAAWSKLKSFSTPEWFIKQFENTAIAKFPKGPVLAYWSIALFEAVLTILFILSPVFPFLNQYALSASLYLFGGLCLGLRIVNDYQGSVNMFVYFAATLISLQMVR
jgi:hypothetical protein